MVLKNIIKEIFSNLDKIHYKSNEYKNLQSRLSKDLKKSNFASKKGKKVKIFKLNTITFPYYSMGSIDTLDLLGLDELVIFCYYYSSSLKYKNVADLGANVGLHSLIMSNFFKKVDSYEPDLIHYKKLKSNLKLNNIKNVKTYKKAVSNIDGYKNFVRILGNTTSSHIKGSKLKVYGKKKEFKVPCIKFSSIINKYDLIKMDVEGEEIKLILDTKKKDWKKTDVIMEVSSKQNAIKIFKYLNKLKIPMYSQKNKWKKVKFLKDIPCSYKEGSLFISSKNKFELVN